MKSLRNPNPGLQTNRCRINCLCSPLDETPLAVENGRRWSLIADPSSPSTVQPTCQAKQDRTRWANRQVGLLFKGSRLSERLGQRDQSLSLNGCLSLCAPFYPSQGPYNPVLFYTNLQFLRDLPAVKVL